MKTKQRKTAPKFTDAERAAMRDRAQELKKGAEAADGEAELLAKIADMPAPDRALGEQLHKLIKAAAPGLTSRLYYGMPAYARDGKVVCWFKPASKFKTRYATLGFSDQAKLDDGAVWPTEYAVTKLGPADEKKIAALVKQAAS